MRKAQGTPVTDVIRIRVFVLVLALEEPCVLMVQHPGQFGSALPGGYVPRGKLIGNIASEYLATQTGLPGIPVTRGLVMDQSLPNKDIEEPETHTYVMAGGYVNKPRVRRILRPAARWVSIESQLRTRGIVKYAIHAAVKKSPPFLILCDGEGTEEEHREAQGYAPSSKTPRLPA
jgi:hypothetical protein